METAVKVRKKQPRKKKAAEQRVATISLPALAEEHMDVSTLETWLWDAACAIRGAADAPKFKDFILPVGVLQATVGRVRRRVRRSGE